MPVILADETSGLSTRIRELIVDLREEWEMLSERIAAFDAEFVSRARTDEAARRLATIPGIGSINAAALVAAGGMDEPCAWIQGTPPSGFAGKLAGCRSRSV